MNYKDLYMKTNLNIKIKVKGCFDCPFRDSELNICDILGTDEFPCEYEPWHGVSVRDVEFGKFHEKCPLDHFIVEVIKDSN